MNKLKQLISLLDYMIEREFIWFFAPPLLFIGMIIQQIILTGVISYYLIAVSVILTVVGLLFIGALIDEWSEKQEGGERE